MANPDDLYEMSDDELANFDFDSIETGAEEEEGSDESSEQGTEEENYESEEEQGETEEEESDELSEDSQESVDNESDDSDEDETDSSDDDEEQEEESDEQEEESTDDSELKALKALIGTPIKAGGKEITLNSANEVKSLVERGLGYYKAMNEIKPIRRFTDTLKQQGLLEEDKVNFMIDLAKGDVNAIKKLVKQHNIDINEFDDEESPSYTPNKHVVSQETADVTSVLSSIKESEKYQDTVNTITSWDNASKSDIEKDPNIIAAINTHMENGMYSRISGEVDKRKLLGDTSLSGKSDLEAYMIVGNELYGGKPDTNQAQGSQSGKPDAKQPDKSKSPNLTKQAQKKKAASPKGGKQARTGGITESELNKLDDDKFDEYFLKHFG